MKVSRHNIRIFTRRHTTAESILVDYLGYDTPGDLGPIMAMRIASLSGGRRTTVARQLQAIKRNRYWAFCRRMHGKHAGEVHYWLTSRVGRARLINMMAHELAHISGYVSETVACKIAGIAEFAYVLARDVEVLRARS